MHSSFRSHQLVIPVGWRTDIDDWDGSRHPERDRLAVTNCFGSISNPELIELLRMRIHAHSVISATFGETFSSEVPHTLTARRQVGGSLETTYLHEDILSVFYILGQNMPDRRGMGSSFVPHVLHPTLSEKYKHEVLLTQVVMIEVDSKGASRPQEIFELSE